MNFKNKINKKRWIIKIIIIALISFALYHLCLHKIYYRFVTDPNLTGLDERNKWEYKNFNLNDGWILWNKNPNFNGNYNSGMLKNKKLDYSPIPKNDWAYQCYSWHSKPWKKIIDKNANIDIPDMGSQPIDECQIIVENNNVKLYGKQDSDRFVWQYGIARVIQGDYVFWHPDQVIQYVPERLKVNDKQIVLSIDYKINHTKSYWWKYPTNWLAISVNIWFTSEKLNKKIVTDLIVYVHGNRVFTREEKTKFIYQYVLSKNSNGWQHINIDLTFIIKERILKHFNINYAYKDLMINDMEFLIEALHGEAEIEIKNFAMYYKSMPEPIVIKLYDKLPEANKNE